MEIQEKDAQDLKRRTLDRKETDFLSCKSKTENFGFHRILTSKAHRKREKISRNKKLKVSGRIYQTKIEPQEIKSLLSNGIVYT
jgi:hypothetical protein